jgi:hypothetical protein
MRVLCRVVAGLLAAALAAAGVITVVEIVAAAAGHGPVVVDWPAAVEATTRNTWSDTGPKVFGAVLAAVGFVLAVLGGQRPGPRPFVLAPAADPGTATFVSRRGVGQALREAALSVDGVVDAKVRVGTRMRRRKAKIDAGVYPDAAAETSNRIAAAARGRLDSLGLLRPPSVRVATAPREPGGDGGRHVVPERDGWEET